MKVPRLFTDFAISSRLDKFTALIWRFLGCDHNTPAYLDIGDNENQCWYCLRCQRKP